MMNEKTTKERFLEIFLREWGLYKRDHVSRPAESGRPADRDGAFDTDVRAGEIRVFASDDRPLLGLLFREWDQEGWFVVPVSDFTVPATEQELLLGTRVYQLWNAFTAPRGYVERSWLVDTVPDDDLKDMGDALVHVMAGEPVPENLKDCFGTAITSLDDPRLEYERDTVVSLDFSAFARSETEEARSPAPLWMPGRENWPDAVARSSCRELSYAQAAASSDGQQAVIWMLEGRENTEEAFKQSCVECRFRTPFRSIGPWRDPYVLRFEAQLPESWKGVGRLDVVARNRKTGETVGEGWIETASGEGRLVTVQAVEDAIEQTEQVVLVVARVEG